MLLLFQRPTQLPSPVIPVDHSEFPRGGCGGTYLISTAVFCYQTQTLDSHMLNGSTHAHMKTLLLLSVLYLS